MRTLIPAPRPGRRTAPAWSRSRPRVPALLAALTAAALAWPAPAGARSVMTEAKPEAGPVVLTRWFGGEGGYDEAMIDGVYGSEQGFTKQYDGFGIGSQMTDLEYLDPDGVKRAWPAR